MLKYDLGMFFGVCNFARRARSIYLIQIGFRHDDHPWFYTLTITAIPYYSPVILYRRTARHRALVTKHVEKNRTEFIKR